MGRVDKLMCVFIIIDSLFSVSYDIIIAVHKYVRVCVTSYFSINMFVAQCVSIFVLFVDVSALIES